MPLGEEAAIPQPHSGVRDAYTYPSTELLAIPTPQLVHCQSQSSGSLPESCDDQPVLAVSKSANVSRFEISAYAPLCYMDTCSCGISGTLPESSGVSNVRRFEWIRCVNILSSGVPSVCWLVFLQVLLKKTTFISKKNSLASQFPLIRCTHWWCIASSAS